MQTKITKKLVLTKLSIAISAGLLVNPLFAQSTTTLSELNVSADYENTANNDYLIKNIKGIGVWGEKPLQDIPYSISVISDGLIDNSNAKDMNQIFKMNPNTQETHSIASNATGNYRATIRGFTVDVPIVNGIPHADRVGSAPAMNEIERVEVISGATGFLYGGGRVGGAVNYITKKPTLENLRTIKVGNFGGNNNYVQLDLGGQFNQDKTVGYRLNTMVQDGKNARKDVRNLQSINAVIDFNPYDNLSLDVSYGFKNSENTGPTILWRDFDRKALTAAVKSNRTFTPDWLRQEFTSHKIDQSIKWQINDTFSLRTNLMHEELVRSYGDARFYYEDNKVLGRPGKRSWLGKYSLTYQIKNGGGIYLDSSFTTYGIKHKVTTGYLFTTNLNESRSTELASNDIEYQMQKDISLDEYYNYAKPSSWAKKEYLKPRTKSSKSNFKNILIGDDITFNYNWQALIGANYASAMDYSYTTNVKYDEGKLTPTLSLIYKPLTNLTTYVTYIESLEKGRIVGTGYNNEGEVFKPYTSNQYELGSKYTLNDNLAINVAIFRLEKANSYDIETLPLPTYSYDGKQIHQGLELGVTGTLSQNLTIMAGGTVLDTEITKTSTDYLKGKKATDVAHRMYKTYAEYQIPNVSGLVVSAGAYYTGKKHATFDPKYKLSNIVPAYTLYDLGVRYTTNFGGNNKVTFNLAAQNITDKVYWGGSSTFGDPRTITFSVKTDF